MNAPSASETLGLWDAGQGQPPHERALRLWAAGGVETGGAPLAEQSIGQRDAALMALRARFQGDAVEAVCNCPDCEAALELSLSLADLRAPAPEGLDDRVVLDGGVAARVRPPTSDDLAAIAGDAGPDQAWRTLLRRCVADVTVNGEPTPVDALADETAGQLADAIGDRDPQAELLLNLACPDCGRAFESFFDIVDFFWIELSLQAKRSLREVALLAARFGWSEGEILAMGDARRRLYLEMVDG